MNWLEGRLRNCGLRANLVDSQEFSFGTNWCVLLGITGKMDGRFIARVKAANEANAVAESWMTGAWSTTNGNEHLVFWNLRPTHTGKGSTIIEIVDTKSSEVLARHRL